MHRVELKAYELLSQNLTTSVPNAPCGVESMVGYILLLFLQKFLMHRVELKGISFRYRLSPNAIVPNAPCGVERHMVY